MIDMNFRVVFAVVAVPLSYPDLSRRIKPNLGRMKERSREILVAALREE
jgi:hypothetical protein